MKFRFIFINVVSLLYFVTNRDETKNVSSLEAHLIVTSSLCVIPVMNSTRRDRSLVQVCALPTKLLYFIPEFVSDSLVQRVEASL